MLRTRIITALILAPLVLAGVVLLPPVWFAAIFCLAAGLALYEWSVLLRVNRGLQLGYCALYLLLAFALYQQPQWYQGALYVGVVAWVVGVTAVLVFPRGQKLVAHSGILAILGLAIVLPGWVALVVIREQVQGAYWLIWLFILVWGADIGGYFAGRAWGQRKLAPQVSPGKTWAGAMGGLVLAGGFCSLGLWLLDAPLGSGVPILLALIGLSIFGDLFESVVKRSTGVKDSGTLLPGHGGVLDRIDSLLAVLPVFALLLAGAVF